VAREGEYYNCKNTPASAFPIESQKLLAIAKSGKKHGWPQVVVLLSLPPHSLSLRRRTPIRARALSGRLQG